MPIAIKFILIRRLIWSLPLIAINVIVNLESVSWISYSNYKAPVMSFSAVHRKLGSELFKFSAYGSVACRILWQITIDIYFIWHLQERETNLLQLIM